MSRPPLTLIFAVFALALLAVPSAFARHGHQRAVRIAGVCTQQSTSKLKLKREDRRTKVEFEVDQNRNGVPWTVTLTVNGNAVASFTATTRAPSGSFEARRVIAGLLRSDRVTAVATQATSGETCTADTAAAKAAPAPATVTNSVDDNDDDNGDDHGGDRGHDSARHS